MVAEGDGGNRLPGGPAVPPLVPARWLADRADEPLVVAVEVDPESRAYRAGHPPGALALDWTRELHEPVRRGFLGRRRFEELMESRGITADTHVVLYGATHPGYAASAYWLLRYYGHDRVSLLDGGKRGWVDGGLPLTEAVTPVANRGAYRTPEPDHRLRISREELLSRVVGAPAGIVLLDARSRGEFQGQVEHPLDLPWEWHRVPGHIPGARSLPAAELLTADGRFRALPELRRLVERRSLQPGDDVEVVVYCRLGEASALLWFVLHELLGHRRTRNYDGGWCEYGSLVDVPVAR